MDFQSPTLIDELLGAHGAALGPAYRPYRNHVHRIFHLTRTLRGTNDATEDRLIAVAGVFHDLGIWTHHTLDYLDPSAELATVYLDETGWGTAAPVVRELVLRHHHIRPVGPKDDLVECFRRADWLDVSQGLLRSGVDRSFYAALKAQYPYEGFHLLLARLGLKQTLKHPLRPLPMMRW